MFTKAEPTGTPKEQLSKHLRSADELTRAQNYEAALLEIDKALQIDPKNNLARQFQERVRLMMKRSLPQTNAAKHEGIQAPSLEERMQLISDLLAVAEDLIAQKHYRLALEKVAEVYKIDPTNYYAQAFSDRITQLMDAEEAEGVKIFHTPVDRTLTGTEAAPASHVEKGSLGMYRELLKEVWFDGKVTAEESHQLAEVRALFGITNDEHERLEREIKVEAYLEALKIVWRDGIASEQEKLVLQQMRIKYGLTGDDVAKAEQKIAEARRGPKNKETILLVDPDRESMIATGKFFRAHGYHVLITQKAEDAFQAIVKQLPDVILSELKFNAGAFDGFAFLEKVKEHPTLRFKPFIFITKTTDAKVLRASLRLGAHHVFAKPLDLETVLAAIEGKIQHP